jgi:hypothetical protein
MKYPHIDHSLQIHLSCGLYTIQEIDRQDKVEIHLLEMFSGWLQHHHC